jgi:hypothetical protein
MHVWVDDCNFEGGNNRVGVDDRLASSVVVEPEVCRPRDVEDPASAGATVKVQTPMPSVGNSLPGEQYVEAIDIQRKYGAAQPSSI